MPNIIVQDKSSDDLYYEIIFGGDKATRVYRNGVFNVKLTQLVRNDSFVQSLIKEGFTG